MKIRIAKAEDYRDIHEVNEVALGYSYDLTKTKENLIRLVANPTQRIIVAEVQDKVVGYVHAADYDCIYADSLKNILALAVLPKYQKTGIGKSLLKAAENWALETGSKGVRLVSGENRQPAHLFYQACEYTLRKTQKNFIKFL